MKKILMTIFAAAAMAFAAHAETQEYKLLVHLNSGDNVAFLFDNTPVATFENNEMTITCNGGSETEKFIISDVAKMTIDSKSTGIGQIESAKPGVTFGLANGTLTAAGLPEGTEIRIFSADGKLMAYATSDSEGRAEVAVGQLGKGIYMVSAGKNSFKFSK